MNLDQQTYNYITIRNLKDTIANYQQLLRLYATWQFPMHCITALPDDTSADAFLQAVNHNLDSDIFGVFRLDQIWEITDMWNKYRYLGVQVWVTERWHTPSPLVMSISTDAAHAANVQRDYSEIVNYYYENNYGKFKEVE
jgi:hypothetical protein